MKTDVLLGLQWGDEGKGKIVDVLTPDYNVIARFQGGPNAGHTLVFNGQTYTLHLIPSGVFRKDSLNLIGNGVVLDPVIFKQEAEALKESGIDLTKNLLISNKTHLILPTHRILDAASEKAKGKTKIGSTLKGIGPTYMDKTGRNGLRAGDIDTADFQQKYDKLKSKHEAMIAASNYEYENSEYEKLWFEGIEYLKTFKRVDSSYFINSKLESGQKVLAEGAQGTLLDIDFGSYPFVTSSNTVAAGACTGLGIAPNRIGEVYGIFKAYCTRVGSGPFPTELFDETGTKMRDIGHEYGATTGRERRCGWLDIPALKYAVQINGVTQLIMTKADVLNTFDTIKVAEAYEVNGEVTSQLPFEMTDKIKPIYKELKGWGTSLEGIDKFSDFPKELNEFISYVEKATDVPITIVSAGPDREETIMKN